MKNKHCYEIKTGHRYNVQNWILINISLHENVGRVGADLHLPQGVHVPSSYYNRRQGAMFLLLCVYLSVSGTIPKVVDGSLVTGHYLR